MVVALIGGVAAPLAALAAAVMLMISRRVEPEALLRQMDWSLLVFFAGLFMVTGALETLGVSEQLFWLTQPIAQQGGGRIDPGGGDNEYLKAGIPIIMLTLLWGVLWLSWRFA
jgi:Na+/H+ antiporter NhaD/arsenite permease-like protein